MTNNSHFGPGSTKPPLEDGVLRCYSMKFCPFGQRSLLALQAKRIPHEIVYVNLRPKPDWFINLTPTGLVPVLEKDGKTVIESLVNMEFLDVLFPERPLQPQDPWKRFHDRGLIDVFGSKVMPHLNGTFFRKVEDKTKSELFEAALNGLEFFENELKSRGTPFFGGQTPGLLDYAIWPWFERIPALKISYNLVFPEERFPVLAEFISNMMNDYAVQQVYIEPQYHVRLMEDYLEGRTPRYDMETNQKLTNFVKS